MCVARFLPPEERVQAAEFLGIEDQAVKAAHRAHRERESRGKAEGKGKGEGRGSGERKGKGRSQWQGSGPRSRSWGFVMGNVERSGLFTGMESQRYCPRQ